MCMVCGQPQFLMNATHHVHHIDYDKNNLTPSNLVTVCKHCHGKMHGSKESRAEWSKRLSDLLNDWIEKSIARITSG